MTKEQYEFHAFKLRSEEKVWKRFPRSCKALFKKLGDLEKINEFKK